MNPLDRVQRESLLRAAVLAGNEDAWRTWYEESYDPLYRYVQWRCGGRPDWADEIVQETWLVAVRRFEPKKACFLAWMRGIAANVLRNDLRRRRRLSRFQQPAEGQLGEAGQIAPPADDWQRDQQVAAALDALAEREEAVLRAKYLEGMSVAEIAAARGETPKAVESLLSRARQAFREVYQRNNSPRPLAGEGNDNNSPRPLAGEGNDNNSPRPLAGEGNNSNSPRPLAGEGPGVRAEYERT